MQWRPRISAVARRPLVLIGLLLLTVGAPEVIIGHTKAGSYRARLEALPPRAQRVDPTQLYPKRTAADEQRAIVEAKVAYYELLRWAGRMLVLLGFASALIGILRVPRQSRAPGTTSEISP